jgi:hypothetical protein
VPLSSSADSAFSRLDMPGGAALDAMAHLLQQPPSKVFDLDGVRSREAHRLRSIEEDRCGTSLRVSRRLTSTIPLVLSRSITWTVSDLWS